MMHSTANTNKRVIFFQNHPWLIVLGASLFYFFVFFQLPMFNAINKEVEIAYNLQPVSLGYLSSVYFLVEAIFLIPLSLLIDRYSARYVGLIVMSFCVLSTFAFALTDSLPIAFLYHAMNGIGNGTAFLISMKYAARWLPQRWKGLGMCLVFAIIMSSGVVAQAPFLLLINEFGWRGAVLINAIVGAVFFIFLMISAVDHPIDKDLRSKAIMSPVFEAARNPQVWLCGFFTTLLGLAIPLMGELWGIRYLSATKDISAISAGNIISMLFIGVLIGVIFFGWLSDTLCRRKAVMLTCNVLALLVLLAILYMPITSEFYLMLLFLLLGYFSGANTLAFPAAEESNSARLTTASLCLVAIVINVAFFINEPLYGWLIELKSPNTTVYTAASFQYAELMLPVAFIISIILCFFIKETYCRRIQP